MQTIFSGVTRKSLAMITSALLAVSSFSVLMPAAFARAQAETVTVTIDKYIDGVQATTVTANNADFPMSATWDAANIGAGTGSYVLGAGNTIPYEAMTANMSEGADYTTNEVTGGPVVGVDCTTDQPFALVGYTTGNTLAAAQAGTPTTTIPTFTGLTHNKHVIVWNKTCVAVPATTTVTVTIDKYVDGAMATASSANSEDFPMNATWNDVGGIGAGSGSYVLGAGNTTPYEAATVAMQSGADYTTNESLDGPVVGSTCEVDKPFSLVGYTTGDTMALAAAGTPTTTAPSFVGLTSNKFVIVWNHDCAVAGGGTGGTTDGTIDGTVTGGTGVLAVTSIDAVDTTGTADGTYANGWKYVFNVTIPTNETGVAMKFSDWASASSTMAVAGNMRISSAQADNAGATITVLAANTYTVPNLNMTADLNPALPGIQVQLVVEVRIPVGTNDASYTTNYGVRTQ